MKRKIQSEYSTSNLQSSMVKEGSFDLKDRLIDYAVRIIRLTEALPDTKAGAHVAGQILRSGTSPAPNYGEALAAESQADFVHSSRSPSRNFARRKSGSRSSPKRKWFLWPSSWPRC